MASAVEAGARDRGAEVSVFGPDEFTPDKVSEFNALQKTGKTVIIVTHDVELIKNTCTSVIRFDPSGSKIA